MEIAPDKFGAAPSVYDPAKLLITTGLEHAVSCGRRDVAESYGLRVRHVNPFTVLKLLDNGEVPPSEAIIVADALESRPKGEARRFLDGLKAHRNHHIFLAVQVARQWEAKELMDVLGRPYTLRYRGASRGAIVEMLYRPADVNMDAKPQWGDISSFKNRYQGEPCVIVGKGRTDFDYQDLDQFPHPVIFINDAIDKERFAWRAAERFFFAHDAWQVYWLLEPRDSTAVIPRYAQNDPRVNRLKLSAVELPLVAFRNNIVCYEWGAWWRGDLAKHTRREMVRTKQLYIRSGTIHSAIHFAWFMGCPKIMFIGCDGICAARQTEQYDPRIAIRSESKPGGSHIYAGIRKVQDFMIRELHLEAEYIGCPKG